MMDGVTLVILTKVNTMEKELSKILMDILAVASGSTAIKQEKELVPFLISQHTLVSTATTSFMEKVLSNLLMDILIVANGLMAKKQDMVSRMSPSFRYLIDIYLSVSIC